MPVKFEHEPKVVSRSTKSGPPMTGTRIKFGSAINAGSKNTQQDILLASVFSRILDMTQCQKEDVAAAAAAAAAAATSVAAPAAIAAPEEASPSREDPDAAAPSSDATVAAPAPNDQGVAAAALEEAPPAAGDAPAATVPVAPAAAGPQADEFEAMYCGGGHGDFGRAVGDFCLRVYKETKYHT